MSATDLSRIEAGELEFENEDDFEFIMKKLDGWKYVKPLLAGYTTGYSEDEK